MRRWVSAAAALLTLLVLTAGIALTEDSGLSIDAPREEIRPGRPVVVSFTVPEDGTCSISLREAEGTSVLSVAEERNVTAGYNAMYWNGTSGGIPVPAGEWILSLWMNGLTAEVPAMP